MINLKLQASMRLIGQLKNFKGCLDNYKRNAFVSYIRYICVLNASSRNINSAALESHRNSYFEKSLKY